MEYVITFNNTNHAIKAEQCLLKHSLHVGVLPLPAELRAGCGISLRVIPDNMEQALGILEDNEINEIGLFSRVRENNVFKYTEVKI